ncbi:MAG: hypothetical protein ACLSCO_17570 [Gallintestinimicrobium sp.]
MNIAIASETEEIDGLVPATFKESPFLMIIDADKNQIFHAPAETGSGQPGILRRRW